MEISYKFLRKNKTCIYRNDPLVHSFLFSRSAPVTIKVSLSYVNDFRIHLALTRNENEQNRNRRWKIKKINEMYTYRNDPLAHRF